MGCFFVAAGAFLITIIKPINAKIIILDILHQTLLSNMGIK